MTAPPPVGPYWSKRLLPASAPLETIRRRATREFDNAARLASPHQVEHAWHRFRHLIDSRFYPAVREDPRGDPPRAGLALPCPTCTCDYSDMVEASVASIEYAAMASILVPALERYGCETVTEIGGGYGGLARAVILTMPELRHWTIIDLPEVARVSRWYLAYHWKAEVIGSETPLDLATNPPEAVVQTRGFMEMSAAEVAYYFDAIQDGTLLGPTGLFWTINRLQKRTNFIDYPWDRHWKVVHKGDWPEAGMIEVLLRRSSAEWLKPVPVQLGLA